MPGVRGGIDSSRRQTLGVVVRVIGELLRLTPGAVVEDLVPTTSGIEIRVEILWKLLGGELGSEQAESAVRDAARSLADEVSDHVMASLADRDHANPDEYVGAYINFVRECGDYEGLKGRVREALSQGQFGLKDVAARFVFS